MVRLGGTLQSKDRRHQRARQPQQACSKAAPEQVRAAGDTCLARTWAPTGSYPKLLRAGPGQQSGRDGGGGPQTPHGRTPRCRRRLRRPVYLGGPAPPHPLPGPPGRAANPGKEAAEMQIAGPWLQAAKGKGPFGSAAPPGSAHVAPPATPPAVRAQALVVGRQQVQWTWPLAWPWVCNSASRTTN
jgi:hypothetical protein